jgi:lysophospholipase L1-like esterase
MIDFRTSKGIDLQQEPRGRLGGHLLEGLAAGILLAAAMAIPALAEAASPRPCPEAGTAALMEGEPARFVARLEQSRSLKIIAIGSSSTAGAGASAPGNAYPDQLEEDLARLFPAHAIDVVNAGVNGQEVPDMLARLDKDVLAHKPDLVIWQFGSNGLLRGRPLAELEEGARLGIQRIRASGAEVVLMDLQHAPRIDNAPARDEILAMMARVGQSTGTPVFHRYRLMKAWAASLGGGYSRMVHADQLHMTDDSYHCMAMALATSLRSAADRRVSARVATRNLAHAVTRRAPPERAASAP